MNPVQVEFAYEQAESEAELTAKAANRIADGWTASSQPCTLKRHMTPEGEVVRFSQAFHRLIFADHSNWHGLLPRIPAVA